MKNKMIFLFFLFNSLSFAEGVPECENKKESLSPLEENISLDLAKIRSNAVENACKDELFLSIKDPKYDGVHTKERCEDIKVCVNQNKEKALPEGIKELSATVIKDAVVASLIEQELYFGFRYNQKGGKIEEPLKPKNCPVEKVADDCRQLIDKATTSVGKDYFKNALPILGAGVKKPKENCSQYASFNKLCTKVQNRLEEITRCEKSSNDCLGLEQKALGAIVNQYRRNYDQFIALEHELCLPERVARVSKKIEVKLSSPLKELNPLKLSGTGFKLSSNLGLRSSGLKISPEVTNLPENVVAEKEEQREIDGPPAPKTSGPDSSDINRIEKLDFASHAKLDIKENTAEDIKGFDHGDTTLSEKFSNSMNEAYKNETHQSELPATWTNNYSYKSDDFNSNEVKVDQTSKSSNLKSEEAVTGQEANKKKEEVNALISQINSLKEKLEDMTASMEELKAKKAEQKTAQDDKEALEREKSILELRKKLAELEADKKRMLAQEEAKEKEEQKRNALREVQKDAGNWKVTAASNAQEVSAPRENSLPSNFSATAVSSASRGPASEHVAGPQASANSGLVLKSNGELATELPPVVYMTAGELQKYPYRLSDNASSGEIEKMILNNNGASIIVGESEQIIPIMEKGAVVLDESGRVKYRRIKIALVKNDKERKRNLERDISSVADLKREEQKRRDLIRYQEMKKAMEKAANH